MGFHGNKNHGLMGFNRIEPDLPSGKFLQFDPENEQFIVETSLPIPIWQGLC
jgi:hypothetical protein